MAFSVLWQSRFSCGAAAWLLLRLGEPGRSAKSDYCKKGLHWHSKISIAVRGKMFPFRRISVWARCITIHTHDDPGVIHMEFDGAVRQDNTRLQKFLRHGTSNCPRRVFWMSAAGRLRCA